MKVGKMRADLQGLHHSQSPLLGIEGRPLATTISWARRCIAYAEFLSRTLFAAPRDGSWKALPRCTAAILRSIQGYRRRTWHVGHCGYRELSESDQPRLGRSYARGNSACLATAGNFRFLHQSLRRGRHLRWKPLRRRRLQEFCRAPAFLDARDQIAPLSLFQTQNAWMYGSAEYRSIAAGPLAAFRPQRPRYRCQSDRYRFSATH